MNPAPPPSHSDTRWGLQLKLILSMLLVGVVPLIVGLGLGLLAGLSRNPGRQRRKLQGPGRGDSTKS